MRTYNLQSSGYSQDNMLKVNHQTIKAQSYRDAIVQHLEHSKYAKIILMFASRQNESTTEKEQSEMDCEPDLITLRNIELNPQGGEQ